MSRILLVEDEPKVVALLKQGLEEQEYQVEIAYDGQMGLHMAQNRPFDLVILDKGLPYVDGLGFLQQLRETNRQLPVLMLTAMGTTADKVAGFEAGADDYLVKPFELAELLMRIRALLRRSSQAVPIENQLQVEDLILDLDRRLARRAEVEILLTAKEFALLEYFMRNPKRVLSRVDIAEKVWEITFDTGTNVVEVYVNLLRKKINLPGFQKLIHTRIGMGYILVDR